MIILNHKHQVLLYLHIQFDVVDPTIVKIKSGQNIFVSDDIISQQRQFVENVTSRLKWLDDNFCLIHHTPE